MSTPISTYRTTSSRNKIVIPESRLRILGIDPGLNVTGYGLIEADTFRLIEAGVVRTRPTMPITERLAKIYEAVSDIIKEHRPDIIVIEKIYTHYQLPMTAILMAHARGVVCLACALAGARLVSYPATRIKKSITGNGAASKAQVQRTVQGILKLTKAPEPVDVTDALAMALSYCFIERHAGLLTVKAVR